MASSSTTTLSNDDDDTTCNPTDGDEEEDVFFRKESKVFRDCDALIEQARLFLNHTTSTLSNNRTTSILSYWSNSHMRKTWIEINEKEEHMVSTLRTMMDEALTHTQSLTLQAAHLRWRLLACVSATSSALRELDGHMNYLQVLSVQLEQEEKHTRSVLHFVNEVMAQREVQVQRSLQDFLRPDYDYPFPVLPNSDGEDGDGGSTSLTVRDRNLVVKRLHQLREAQSETNLCYTLIQQRHQGQKQLLGELRQVQRRLRQPLPRGDTFDLNTPDYCFCECISSSGCVDGCGCDGDECTAEGKSACKGQRTTQSKPQSKSLQCTSEYERHTTTTTTTTSTSTTTTATFVSISPIDTDTDTGVDEVLEPQENDDHAIGTGEPCQEESGTGLYQDEPYDHALCSDCSVVCDLAHDCVSRLRNMQRKAHSSLSRLQTLLQIREDLLAVSAPLHITGHSATHISGHAPGTTSSVGEAT